jgi:acyl carrier protein
MDGTPDSMEAFVMATIAELAHCEAGEVVEQASLVDLGVDSLAIATLATFVEAEFGCTFSPEQLTRLYSAMRVNDVLAGIRQAPHEAAGGAVPTVPRERQAI